MGGLNSDDFPFFWNLSSLSGSRESSIQSSSDGLVARERQRLPKNSILGQKQFFFLKIQKIPRTKTEVFSDCNGQNLFRTVDETSKNQTVWPQKKPKKKKKKKKKK